MEEFELPHAIIIIYVAYYKPYNPLRHIATPKLKVQSESGVVGMPCLGDSDGHEAQAGAWKDGSIVTRYEAYASRLEVNGRVFFSLLDPGVLLTSHFVSSTSTTTSAQRRG